MARFLEVKNWRTYQHYSDRRPPWIKNHVALLDDIEYIGMSEGGRAALHAIWLLAARFGHPLPNDPKLLKERGGIPPKRIAELIRHGWLLATDAPSASAVLAGREQVASEPLDEVEQIASLSRARTRARERERESTEGENRTDKDDDGGALVGAFTDHTHRDAYAAYRRGHRMPDGFDATLRAVQAPPTGGARYDWDTIGRALVEMRGASVDFTPAVLRGFCRRIVADATATAAPADTAEIRRRALESLRAAEASA